MQLKVLLRGKEEEEKDESKVFTVLKKKNIDICWDKKKVQYRDGCIGATIHFWLLPNQNKFHYERCPLELIQGLWLYGRFCSRMVSTPTPYRGLSGFLRSKFITSYLKQLTNYHYVTGTVSELGRLVSRIETGTSRSQNESVNLWAKLV